MENNLEEKLEMQQALITDAEIIEKINQQISNKIEGEHDDSIMASCTVFSSSEDQKLQMTYIAFADLPSTHEERAKMFEGIGGRLVMEANQNPVMALFMFEAWAASYESPEEQKEAYKKYGNSLQDHPESVEVFICSAMTLDGRSVYTTVPFSRDSSNNIVFEEFKELDEDSIINPFLKDPKDESLVKDYNLSAFFAGVSIAAISMMLKN